MGAAVIDPVRTMDRARIALLAVVFTGAMLVACGGSSSAGAGNAADANVPVTKVTDGDTLHVTYQGKDERVRLIGIDTPEVAWYGGVGECFGPEAGLYARSRLANRSVRLTFDVNLRDRYGRLLAYVYVGDELFNETLVRLGYATADPVAPDTRLRSVFEEAEASARSQDKGLWQACPAD